MRLSIKFLLLSAMIISISACDTEPSTSSSSSSSGSSGSSGSGSSSATRGSCFTENVCAYYFDMTSSKYAEISNGCTTATGWVAGVNSCDGMIGGSRTQVCQQTASDSKVKTYSYGHTQEGALNIQDVCRANGGTSDIFNF